MRTQARLIADDAVAVEPGLRDHARLAQPQGFLN